MVCISGILFLAISLLPLRNRLIDAIPIPFKFAVSAGAGLLITLSGLIHTGLVTAENNLLDMGNFISPGPLLAMMRVFLTSALLLRHVHGAVLLGIAAVTVTGISFGVTVLPEYMTAAVYAGARLSDFAGLPDRGMIHLVSARMGLILSQCFDAVGTLLGAAMDAGMTGSTGGHRIPFSCGSPPCAAGRSHSGRSHRISPDCGGNDDERHFTDPLGSCGNFSSVFSDHCRKASYRVCHPWNRSGLHFPCCTYGWPEEGACSLSIYVYAGRNVFSDVSFRCMSERLKFMINWVKTDKI